MSTSRGTASPHDADELLLRGLADLLVKNNAGRLDRHPAESGEAGRSVTSVRAGHCAAPGATTRVDLATAPPPRAPSPEPDVTLRPGLVLEGKRVLIRSIGSGSFGTVYEARHLGLDRLEAIKFLHERWVADPEVRGRFIAEARLMARMRGSHLAEVYDWGLLTSGRPYFVMERLEGQTLRARLNAPTPLSLDEFFDIAAELLTALDDAHTTDIVHRDIKPENIFLTAGGVRLLDFGLARSAWASCDHDRAGTPLYMAPEVITGRAPHDARSDLYALSIIMVEMLVGHHPFRRAGRRRSKIEGAAARPPMALPCPLPRELPPGLGALVAAGLARSRDRRPPSAREMLDQLTAIHRRWWPLACRAEAGPRAAGTTRRARRRAGQGRARRPRPFGSLPGPRLDERGITKLAV